jgi:transcriptional regulator with XRE-family HTH domain
MTQKDFTDTTIIRGVRSFEARKRLIAARHGKGWSQQRLARETGWDLNKDASGQAVAGALSPARIANFEQGTRGIGFEAAESIARAFRDAGPSTWFMGLGTKKQAEHVAVEEGQGGVFIFEPPEDIPLPEIGRPRARGRGYRRP